ncbi:MAG: thioredoxin fold domain-containing protein [Bacteroidetes bacterium]|nr:thioredoxin fold domain-containing protein [Bacteroidota bacterium]
MKRILFVLLCLFSIHAFAQKDADTALPPYKKYPTLPAFNIQLLDSTTIFNTFNIQEGRYTLLIFFSTDCDHCQMMTDSLLSHRSELKNIQICMFAPQALPEIRAFYAKNNIKNYRNIMMGKDVDMFFHKFYKAYYVPCLVVYDKQKKFVKFFEGGAKMKDLLACFQ